MATNINFQNLIRDVGNFLGQTAGNISRTVSNIQPPKVSAPQFNPGASIRNFLATPVTNPTILKINTGMENINRTMYNAPVLGSFIKAPMQVGDQGAKLILSGINQIKTGQPSNFMGMNISPRVAAPAKIALGALSPLGAPGEAIGGGLKDIANMVPGMNKTALPGLIGFGASMATPVPGGQLGKLSRIKKLEGAGQKIAQLRLPGTEIPFNSPEVAPSMFKLAQKAAQALERAGVTSKVSGRTATLTPIVADVKKLSFNDFDLANATRDVIDKAKKELLEGKFRPIVIAEDGGVLDGTHRLIAAKELGIEQLPAVIQKINILKGPTTLQQVNKLAKMVYQATEEGSKARFQTSQKGKVLLDKVGRALPKDILSGADKWKDKPKLFIIRETLQRNVEDIAGKDASKINDFIWKPVQAAEANRMRWLNQERIALKSLGIKPGSVESALLQQFGEGKVTQAELIKQTPQWERIINAEKIFRAKYDQYLKDINSVLVKNGYNPIPKREDYFHHFQDITSALERFGIPSLSNKLPTDIAGLTDNFQPGKNFFSAALPRLGDQSKIDAVGGMDRYLEGASKQIFHTDNIQRLRLFTKALRDKYQGTEHLSNFVSDLLEYTNKLAGKNARIDRAAEDLVGRGIYGAATGLQRQVGANMIGANVAAALTNFIPFTQALATTNKVAFMKGMLATMSSVFRNDGMIQKSDFLTRRLGSDPLAISSWDKVGKKAFWLMKTLDQFVAGTLVRGKYYEGISKGMSPAQALEKADDWTNRIMAGRSLGSMPTLFNSKTLGFLSQFQLEVNNQMSVMFKDIPREYNTVGAASALAQLFVYSYVFNNIYEGMFGRRPAFDPIGVAKQAYEDYSNPLMKQGQATKNLAGNISQQLPFTSITSGGRFPVGSAIPDVAGLIQGTTSVGKEITKPLFTVLPPAGGMPIKRGLEGLMAWQKGASTTGKGQVRYPIAKTPANLARTTLGGQYSTPEAREYFREGQSVLGKKQSQYVLSSANTTDAYNKVMAPRLVEQIRTAVKNGNLSTEQALQLVQQLKGMDTSTVTQPVANQTKKQTTPPKIRVSTKKLKVAKPTLKSRKIKLTKLKTSKPATFKLKLKAPSLAKAKSSKNLNIKLS